MVDLLGNSLTVYTLCFLIGFVLANNLSKGLIMTLIRVKVFKQGNVVVNVGHKLEDYFVSGQFEKTSLSYTARKRKDNEDPKRILSFSEDSDVSKKAVFRAFGCDCVLVDDTKNSIYIRENGSYVSVGGFNAEAMAETVDTALKKPPEDETALMPPKKFQIFVLIGIGLLGVGLYFIYKTIKQHDANTAMIYDMVKPMYDYQMNITHVAQQAATNFTTGG